MRRLKGERYLLPSLATRNPRGVGRELTPPTELFSDPWHARGHPYAQTHNNNNKKINAVLCLAASEGVEDQKADCGGLGEAWEPAFCTSASRAPGIDADQLAPSWLIQRPR